MIKETLVMELEELGRLVVRVHPRAKSLIFRAKRDAIYVSVPPGTTTEMVRQAAARLHHRLLSSRRHARHPLIDLNYKIATDHFTFSLLSGDRDTFFANSRPGHMQVICPPGTDFADERLQQWLRSVIEQALKQNAARVLPARLEQLSRQYGLPYATVRVNSSQGRWGSCSSRKSIHLSCYLLLLPAHLTDYVLLHELCHTREMNHGAAFWELLNRLTDGRALSLRAELRHYSPFV